MKKLIVGLLAAFLMATGLVALSGTSATAACPYTSCVATKTTISGPASTTQNKKLNFTIRTTATRGTARAVGKVTVTITGPGGYRQKVTKSVTGNAFKVATRKLTKVGRYKVTVKYTPKAGSVFKASSKTKAFTVKKRRG